MERAKGSSWRFQGFSAATRDIQEAGIRFPASMGKKKEREMDRRTLLAFALLTLILVLFTRVASPPKTPPETPPSQAESSASPTEAPERTAAAESPTGEPAAEAVHQGAVLARGSFRNTLDTGQPRTIPIRMGPYTTDVSTHGGRLLSWVLHDYTDAAEGPADLVADPEKGMIDLRVELPSGAVDLSDIDYQASTLDRDGSKIVRLAAKDSSGARVELVYEFPRDGYTARISVRLDGFSAESGDAFFRFGFPSGISYLERDPKYDRHGAAGVALLGKRYIKHGLGRGDKAWSETESGVLHWVGSRSKYFLLAAMPQGSPDGEARLSRKENQLAIASAFQVPLSRDGHSDFEVTLFAGPMKFPLLASYDVGLEKAVDMGWSVIVPISRLLLRFFTATHRLVPNYGIVILILSVLTKVLFYPLTKKSMESMKKMQLLKPEIDRITAKYKEDPARRNQAMMDLYKKNKVNPVGGCLPVLIQMPVFIALYNVLNTSIELRKAPFALWIQDLSAPDKVASIAGFPINVLPLVMAATMFWQQKLTPTDPRQAAMAYMMPAVMTIFFYTLPSGLVFYWTVNNLMSIGQQIWMNRTMKHTTLAQSG